MTQNSVRTPLRDFPLAGLALLAGGLALLSWVGWSTLVTKEAPPYRYHLVQQGKPEQFPELGLPDLADLTISRYEIRTDGIKQPLVTLHSGQRGDAAPVLLDWRNLTAEPLLTLSAPIDESVQLAQAVAQHVPSGAGVLAWWDISRRLELLTEMDIVFGRNLAEPILLPTVWYDQQESVTLLEHDFWRVSNAPENPFERFISALLMEPTAGAAQLSKLTSGKASYLVVHLTDAYRLGALRPESFGIGYKDFPNTGRLHGLVGSVKSWLKEQGYDNYFVSPLGDTSIRVFFLTDTASGNTLLAQLLPFTQSNPLQLEALKLVANYGGYWVYRLAPVNEET